jgi:flagellin
MMKFNNEVARCQQGQAEKQHYNMVVSSKSLTINTVEQGCPLLKSRREFIMIINHNLGAMNANRMMGVNQANANKSMEKLSSGMRINKAGDDAAGLAISEKMRGQIRGLDQASANAQDAISMIQTGEGALNETHSILQRMRELAVQSATDTNTYDDRAKIQGEVDELAKEITRISNTTEFNTQNLMAGGLDNTFHVGANQDQNVSLKIGAMDAKSLGVAASSISTSLTAANGVTSATQVTEDLGAGAKVTVSSVTAVNSTINSQIDTDKLAVSDNTYAGATNLSYTVAIKAKTGNVVDSVDVTSGGVTTTYTKDGAGKFDMGNGVKFTIADNTAAVGTSGSVTITAASAQLQLANTAGNLGTAVTVRNGQTDVVLGNTTTGQTAKIGFNFAALTNGDVAISQTITGSTAATTDANGNVAQKAVVEKGINVSTQATADKAITTLNNAIVKVSEERSKLGAMQNRLEHTIANLGTSSENLTSAESRIRDVNMAKEMSTFSKNNILSQAAQAMLAQANQQPQQVLQLLR